MIYNLAYMILTALALGFLIFIHELGHYFMALRAGMTVEAFSIGFGKPLMTWEHRGVKWQICLLPFGGYVRIAGMEKRGSIEPHEIADGFYGKKPWARIKVALMGPIVNIVFAFVAFAIIWTAGGRAKPFNEYTHTIGWVDPQSKLYERGLRPGDQITGLDGRPFNGFTDLMYAAFLDNQIPILKGTEVDYFTHEKKPFEMTLPVSPQVKDANRAMLLSSMMAPASYLIYGKDYPVSPHSPMAASGIQFGDRLLWANGELVFSTPQLITLINEQRALFTIQRGDKLILTRLPRVKVSDLRISSVERGEIDDWRHEASLNGKVQDLYFIPYNLTADGVVENSYSYLDEESNEHIYKGTPRSECDSPLEKGDKIVAVDGLRVTSAFDLLDKLQTKRILMIVSRKTSLAPFSWKDADKHFEGDVNFADLKTLINAIGAEQPLLISGNLALLNPVTPLPHNEFSFTESLKAKVEDRFAAQKEQIEEIKDPKERAKALRYWEESQKKLMLGIVFQDHAVNYNPSPLSQFIGVFQEMYRTIFALVTGYLSPKFLSGPVGIVQVIHHGWTLGIKEALFYMAVISLNLGVINLLPIPVLDGGHICFSVWEAITGKPIKSKTMERLIIPFVVLLIAFFIFLTYHDIVRIIKNFF